MVSIVSIGAFHVLECDVPTSVVVTPTNCIVQKRSALRGGFAGAYDPPPASLGMLIEHAGRQISHVN